MAAQTTNVTKPPPESAPQPILKKIGNAIVDNIALSLAAFVVAALVAGAGGMLAAMSWYWHTYVDIPSGLVVASLHKCGDIPGGGWKEFEAGGGRFIVGAGRHLNPGINEYDVFTTEGKAPPDRLTKATGGKEKHELTIDEMPSHNHAPDSRFALLLKPVEAGEKQGSSAWDDWRDGVKPNVQLSKKIETQGGGQPHPNIPPYVALYYCQKM